MSQTVSLPRPYHQLQKITTVVLLFQAVFVFAQLFNDRPQSNGMVGILVATIVMAATNRRLFADPQGRHANFYLTLLRYGVLTVLGALSLLVALDAYAPDAVPNGMPTLTAMLLATVIALKGAMLGKLRPGGVLGLRLPWTCRSRLAWEKAHRLMGRILFFGGLIALVASPFVHFAATFVAIGGIVIVGVTAAAIESWRVWRNDPEREISRR
jgi:uncharacterized membrane protein